MIPWAGLLALAFLPNAGQSDAPPPRVEGQAADRAVIGTPFSLRLAKDATPRIHPAKAPPAGSFAGGVEFDVATAGDYRIGLSEAGWIEVARNGEALPSAAHAHGDAGGPYRKWVTFHLEPGRYWLQVTGVAGPIVQLGILPK